MKRIAIIAIILLGVFLPGIAQKNEPRALSVSSHFFLHDGFNTGGVSYGAGLRYGSVEGIGFYTTRNSIDYGGGGALRFFIPGLGRQCRPYIEGRYAGAYMPNFRNAGTPFRAGRFQALSLNLGVEYNIFKGLLAYISAGPVSQVRVSIPNDPNSVPSWSNYPSMTIGLKYEFYIQGQASEKASNPKPTPGAHRFFISYRTIYWPRAENVQAYSNERFNHHLGLDWELNQYFRLSGLVQMGQVSKVIDAEYQSRFAFKSMGIGMKVYGIRRGRWAYFNDIYFSIAPGRQTRVLDKLFHLSHNIAYRVFPGVELDLGYGFSIAQADPVHSIEAGVTFGLREIFKR